MSCWQSQYASQITAPWAKFYPHLLKETQQKVQKSWLNKFRAWSLREPLEKGFKSQISCFHRHVCNLSTPTTVIERGVRIKWLPVSATKGQFGLYTPLWGNSVHREVKALPRLPSNCMEKLLVINISVMPFNSILLS